MNALPHNLDDLTPENLTPALLELLRLRALSERQSPEEILKWLSEQYTKMYQHVISTSDDDSEPNYQLVANFLTDAPEWNEQLVEYFTRLATLQGEL